MGLCVLHLLTGECPYEELLKDVDCPSVTADKLNQIWLDNRRSSPYSVVKEVLDSLDDENATLKSSRVFCDTLYRYIVLFGIPVDVDPSWAKNPVWRVLCSLNGPSSDPTAGRRGHRTRGRGRKDGDEEAEACKAYAAHRSLWGVDTGTAEVMVR